MREVEGTPVDQVCVGSCTNSSYVDLMTVAAILQGKKVHPSVSFTVTPGLSTGPADDLRVRRADGPDRRRRPHPGVQLRSLQRHGPGPCHRHRLRPHLQPQLPRPLRHQSGPGLPLQPPGGGSHRRDRPDYRPPPPGRSAPDRSTRAVRGRRRDDPAPRRGPGAGGDPARTQHQAAPQEQPARREPAGSGAAEDRRQHQHRRHHPRGRQARAAALQRAGLGRVRLRADR